ncbi:DUF4279 domain-containing protein [Xenorhabdus bovienii]|uniref:DUF4279 domain-containing protein n=2 Tax=Xenorhabdus bovienii TaxID=40576 RepID=A0A077ND94_XENBV|nr:DUF4279 domain-containing protein [Xenorhabdus bovienii]CDG89175.1 conserved hypothetical protein [Xenorhabdus bovienii str. feltiae France]CDG93625.1 conserved hypothetical protein [Xenorhabdus bovienii str. feltiae Florida]CDG96333.1 conserved hypothetical protein [Xenorhabdus bovienii str. puntauvense]CDH01224.1 conserved hypothetical protein [Xenorhabdus bovienii str. feltiae Moldova]
MTIKSRETPVNPDYPTCDECYAKLMIYPEYIHPDEVSSLLQLEPTKKNIVGTKITSSSGRTREIKIAGWLLSSENYVNSKDIRDHLDWLLNKISKSSEGLKQLQNTDKVTMRIDCVWRSIAWHGGPTLWPEQMKIMSDLGLECSFDIYFVGEE